jgi:transcriptional regulator with XRE-family HTH domain
MPRVNSRNPETDPAAFLGQQLRRVRLAADYPSQESFGAALHMSQDQVSRAENGNQPPMDDVLDRWMELCGVTGAELEWFKGMVKVARAVNASRKGSGVREFARPWFEAEAEAAILHLWGTTLIPGLFQTEKYARPLFEVMGLDEDEVQEQVGLRLGRQAILYGEDRVQVICLLLESVLYLQIGSPEDMVRQLDHLLAMSKLPNVTIQIVRTNRANAGLAGAFEIASAHAKPDTVVIPAIEDQTREDPALTRLAAILFELVRRQALTVGDSRVTMTEARDHWKSQQI